MLNKVMKKMKALEKKSGDTPVVSDKKYPTSQSSKGTGFHAKANSQQGAARQRSIGNRNQKPSR